jgi:hypothetical protein
MNTLKPIIKFLAGLFILLAATVGAYYLGKEFCSFVFEFEAKEATSIIPIWFTGICLEVLACTFLSIAYAIGDRLLD